MRKHLFLFLCGLLAALTIHAQTSVGYQDNWPKPNGTVIAIVRSGNTVYLGGSFTSIAPAVSYGAALGTGSGSPDLSYALPNGVVRACVADGAGGWYIGGSFTQVGGQTRNYMARINADGTLHPWNPNADASVYALAVSGGRVYAGGTFTTVGGQTRSYIAAIDTTTGAATSWNPGAGSTVYALAVSGGTVYAGGFFATIGGQSRNRIAALDTATGAATSWNPNSNSTVNALAVSGGTVYVGGIFTNIGGQNRGRIAAIDTATGNATSWNPSASNNVNALAVSGGTVYAGGIFTNIGGQNRSRIAALSATNGAATAWDPGANNAVQALAVSGSTVYVGGSFGFTGGQTRSRIAAIDATTGAATSWNPTASSTVVALAVSGSTVYAGGAFTTIGGQTRNRIAAIDATTGTLTSWNPSADNTVAALTVSGSTVYVGGNFASIGGQSRSYIAAIDATTGTATAWNPTASSNVVALAVSGSTVYAGGTFTSIGGQFRNRIAAIDTTTGAATSWNPSANDFVNALTVSGGTVYAGGGFTSIGGQSRNRIAAIDKVTGVVTSWNPGADNNVATLAISGGTVYAGGYFTSIGGQSRGYIAAIDAATGVATAWNPTANSIVYGLAVSGSTVYAGGAFGTIGGQSRSYIAAIDTSTGAATAWNPSASGTVYTFAVSGSTVYAGGVYTSMGGNSTRSYFMPLVDSTNLPGVAIAASANPVCAGASVTFTATPTNASSPTYQWTKNGTAVSGATAATYATTTLANGDTIRCQMTSSGTTVTSNAVTMTVNASPIVTVVPSGPTTFCAGNSVELSPSTAAAYPTYLWSNGETTEFITTSTSGNYSVTITDGNNGCSATSAALEVTVNPLPRSTVTAGGPTTFCAGSNVTLGGRPHNYSYLWSNGATTQFITATASGNYSVTVTDANGCVATSAATTVTVNPLPSATIMAGGATAFCAGGSVTLTASAGSSYLWSNGATTQSVTATASDNYSVTVTDANGCVATSPATAVTVYQLPDATVTASGPTTFCPASRVTLSAPAGMSSYQWNNGDNTQSSIANTSGNYIVTVTDANGCVATSAATAVTVNPLPSATITPGGPTAFYAGGNVVLTAGTGASYQWSNNGNAISGAAAAAYTATDSGSYTVTVTDSNSCSAISAATTVTVSPLPAFSIALTGGGGQQSVSYQDNWPKPNSTVNVIVRSGNTVYIGGAFTSVDGVSRDRLAAFDATTGALLPWNPTVNNAVYALVVSGNTVYAGGTFRAAGGQSRNYVAAFDATTGSVNSWNPSANNAVLSLALNGNKVYVGGLFNRMGLGVAGQTRNRLAAIDTNGALLAWNPNANNDVSSMAVSGNTVFVGGSFTTMGGYGRGRLAAVDATTGTVTSWNPNANGTVSTLAVSGSMIYTGGSFTVIGANNQSRSYLAALDITTGDATAWNPASNGGVRMVAVGGNTVYACGSFSGVGGQSRSSLAAIDATTGNVTNWNPGANGTVGALAVSGSTVYAGGAFTSMGGNSSRKGFMPLGTVNSVCAGASVTFTATASNVSSPAYQWTKNSTAIAGETASTYTTTTLANNDTIACVLSLGGGASVTSNPVVVPVNPLPDTTVTASGATTFCAGGSVTLSVPAGAASYQWYDGNTAIGGATSASYTATTSGSYTARVSNAFYCGATSAATVVTVNPLPTPSVIAVSATTFCAGGSVVLRSGGVNNETAWRWSTGTGGISSLEINSLTIVRASGSYSVTVTDGNGCVATSAATTVTVNPLPTATISASQNPFCVGTTVPLTATSSNAGYSYQWKLGTTTLSTTTDQHNATAAGSYTVAVTDTNGCVGTSAALALTTKTPPAAFNLSANKATTFCAGGSVTLSPNTSASTLASFPAYQWSNNGVAIAGATSASYAATASGNYTIALSDNAGCGKTSVARAVTVNANPVPSISTPLNPFCVGGSAVLSASPSGSGNAYRWTMGTTVLPSTTAQQTTTAAGSYQVRVTDANGCVGTSAAYTLTTKALPPVFSLTANAATTFCSGGSVTLSPNTTAVYPTYQWSNNGAAISGATARAYAATASGNYTLTLADSIGCSRTSTVRPVTVNPNPVTSITASGPTTFCAGGSVVFTADSTTGQTNTWLVNGVSSGTSNTRTATASGNYQLQATLGTCTALSTVRAVTVNALPSAAITTSTPANAFCTGSGVMLNAVPAVAGNTYGWMLNGMPLTATTAQLTATNSGSYTVTITNGNGCARTSTAYALSLSATPAATITALGSTTIGAGGTVTLQAPAGTGLRYQWYRNGVILSGVTGRSIVANTAGSYTVMVTNGSCAVLSSAVVVSQTANKESLGVTSGSDAVLEQYFSFSAFPNPAGDHVTVRTNGAISQNATVQVMTLTGAAVKEVEMNDAQTEIDLSGMASGVYLLRYKDAEGRTGIIRLVKQ